MRKPLFTGACTALVTPFLDGQVNYPMMEQLLRRQMDAGIKAVVICGTTGEAPTLSDAEKLELFSRAKHYTGGLCKIIAGTGSNSTAHTVQLSKAAESCGADALLVEFTVLQQSISEWSACSLSSSCTGSADSRGCLQCSRQDRNGHSASGLRKAFKDTEPRRHKGSQHRYYENHQDSEPMRAQPDHLVRK